MSEAGCPAAAKDAVFKIGGKRFWPPAPASRPEPPERGPFAFLYAATSPLLVKWSREIGFDAAHIGICADPLAKVASFRTAGYAALSYFIAPFEEDFADVDWRIMPMEFQSPVPDGCRPWAGLVRIALPAGSTAEELACRLAVLLRPLEALRCAHLPQAVERRAAAGSLLPVQPLYTLHRQGAALVQDVYRLDAPEDWAFVARILGIALALSSGGDALLRGIEACAGAMDEGASCRAECDDDR